MGLPAGGAVLLEEARQVAVLSEPIAIAASITADGISLKRRGMSFPRTDSPVATTPIAGGQGMVLLLSTFADPVFRSRPRSSTRSRCAGRAPDIARTIGYHQLQ